MLFAMPSLRNLPLSAQPATTFSLGRFHDGEPSQIEGKTVLKHWDELVRSFGKVQRSSLP
jgi:hypothetical protein